MHECPGCGMVCDCDGEDTWYESASDECTCGCTVTDEDFDVLEDDTAAPRAEPRREE